MRDPTPILLPYRGVADNTPFALQPGDTCPPDRLRNYRTRVHDDKRPQGGSRNGLVSVTSAALGDGPVQAVASVRRARTQVGLVIDRCYEIDEGGSIEAGPVTGNVWWVDDVMSLLDSDLIDVTAAPFNAAAHQAGVCCAVSADGTRWAACVNIGAGVSSTGRAQSVIRIYDSDRATVGTLHLSDTVGGVFVNTMAFSDDGTWLFAAGARTAAGARGRVFVLKGSDASLAAEHTLNSWAYECIEVAHDNRINASTGRRAIYVAFLGVEDGRITTNGGTISAGVNARHFGAGVMRIEYDHTNSAAFFSAIVPFGPALSSGDTWHEGNHNYHRFSEHQPWRPYGLRPQAMCLRPDGVVYVAHSNQAYGPFSPTYDPNGTVPYTTLYRINANGTRSGDIDPNQASVREVGAGGFINDIPTVSGDYPTFQAIDTDRYGDVYIAGRSNSAGFCIHRVDGETGDVVWSQNLMGSLSAVPPHPSVLQSCLRIDPADNNLIVGGSRNNNWAGAAGQMAHIWKVNYQNGAILQTWDLEQTGIFATGVACKGDGTRMYTTQKV